MKTKENISDLIGDWDLMNIEHEEAEDVLVKYFFTLNNLIIFLLHFFNDTVIIKGTKFIYFL